MNIIRILGIWYSSLFAYYYLMFDLTYFFPNSLIFCFSFYEQTSGYPCLIWRYQPHLVEIRCRSCINDQGIGWCHHDMAFNQILFDVIVLNWRNLIVEFLHLLWDFIYCCYMMVLRLQGCYTQTDVAGTGYCYCYIFEIFHHYSVIFSKTYPSFLTVKEGFFSLSVSPARRAPLSPQAPLPQEAGM